MAGAPIDHRAEALYLLGELLKRHANRDVLGISVEKGNRDIAVITFYDSIRNCEITKRVSIACDSVTSAIRDVMREID